MISVLQMSVKRQDCWPDLQPGAQ